MLVRRAHSQKKSAERRTQSKQTSPLIVSPEVMMLSPEVQQLSPQLKQKSPFKLLSPFNRPSPPKLLEDEVRPSVLARAGAVMGLFELRQVRRKLLGHSTPNGPA